MLFCILNILLFINSIIKVSTIFLHPDQDEQCIGKHQIPFDNKFGLRMGAHISEPINLTNFDVLPEETIMENNDYTIILNIKYNGSIPTIRFGPSADLGIFRFEFMYFQWFEKSLTSLPIELHLVFYNTRVKNFQQALKHNNYIMALAFNMKMINDNTLPAKTEHTTILKNLERVRIGKTKSHIENVPLKSWLPEYINDFLLYEGYLTFFSCKTQVIWMDFLDPINLEPEAIKEFELLETYGGAKLMKQYISFAAPNKDFATNAEVMTDNHFAILFINDFEIDDKYAFNAASFQILEPIKQLGVLVVFFGICLMFY